MVAVVESFAAAALRAAHLDDDRPDPRLFCKRLGIGIILSPAHLWPGRQRAQAITVEGRQYVRLRAGIPPWIERFALLHEAAHILVARHGLALADEERFCNELAGAIALPREPLLRAWRRAHDLHDVLSYWPQMGPTSCVLRLGEARFADTVVLAGRRPIFHRCDGPLDIEAFRTARSWRLVDGADRSALVLPIAA